MPVRLRISKADALIIGGAVHVVCGVSDSTLELRPLDGSSDLLCFSHADVKRMIDECKASIEYGYFSGAQAARRALASSALISRMGAAEKAEIFRKQLYVECFLEAEANGEVSRSNDPCVAFLPRLEKRVEAKILEQIRLGGDEAELGKLLSMKHPGRTALMAWVRDWEKTRDPMCFVKKSRFNGANAKRVSSQVESAIQTAIKTYLHPGRVLIPHVAEEANRVIRELNRSLALSDQPPEREVSESTVRRRIADLDQFEVCAAREGVAKAKNKLGPYGQGLEIEAPLQRIEMDEWQIDLIAMLEEAGIDVSEPKFDDLRTGRFWVCVAIDAATRVILAIKMARTPSHETALATLWLAMRNKSEISKQLGCKMEWSQHGHIFNVVVDNGASFVNPEFKAALADLWIGYEVLPAGVPKLRGRIERVFRTLGTMFMPLLTGRTFSNPQERGDYPSDKCVVHTADSIAEVMVRFVVDAYHHRAHRGLEYATPADTWDRLIGLYGHSPPKSPHLLRHFLGIPQKRQLGRHGVLICGIAYTSRKLAAFFQRRGPQQVDLRIDPEDMGYVSAWFGDAWHTIPAGLPNARGTSLAVWDATIRELRRSNKAAARLHIEVVDAALERIKQVDDHQRAWRQIGPLTVSARDIRRAEHESFYGLNFGAVPGEVVEKPSAKGTASLTGRLADIAASKGAGIEGALSVNDVSDQIQPPDDPRTEWRFSDEDEQE
ncbi:Mu transposase C-terminal domain-containing protein [Rhodovulum kholense]|uniref:Mu transposase-like protein n=1 Tax=Rhodovulum kholense TaxID=453584 RepID=A0A8E3ANR7_9RHOB|nr:Mu transposase C-terminal domain-containing protein [Rhodovulum kholense]PTW37592.1 Mu transposase-like protein [Rhodovulum kholense]